MNSNSNKFEVEHWVSVVKRGFEEILDHFPELNEKKKSGVLQCKTGKKN